MSDQEKQMDRRKFLATSANAAIIAPIVMGRGPFRFAPSGKAKQYCLVGTGTRGINMWGRRLVQNYGDIVEFVGLCDRNPGRLQNAKRHMEIDVPVYLDTEFDKMIRETKPDTVIVTTTDCFHAKYICRAMELGCDVITEKPMATDEKMCQEIVDTEKRTGKKVRVTFNYRYNPEAEKIKEILNSGELGQVTSVDYNYFLNTSHGASYFRRWHGFKQYGGSLWVHKATHHFDLLNWWLGAEPMEVNAQGDLRKYGWNSPFRGKNCRTCPHTSKCDYYMDITKNEGAMRLYVDNEKYDGYLRDACLFREEINVWDTMSANIRYHNDILLTYSLNCFMPYEGYQVGFNCTNGRLDVRVYHSQPWEQKALSDFRVSPLFSESRTFSLSETEEHTAGKGGHWGADLKMQDMVFRGTEDPMEQTAGTRAGAMSIMVGIAARRSIEWERTVRVDELVKY